MSQAKAVERVAVRQHKWNLLQVVVGAESDSAARQALWGYAFISPWILGLLFFAAGPVLYCLFLSFHVYDILSTPKWIGSANYHEALFTDPLFWSSLVRTFKYSIIYVPTSIIGSLILAVFLDQKFKGIPFFRTAFFMPSLTPAVATAVIWVWLMNPQIGPLNLVLSFFGFPEDFPWYTDHRTVIPSLVIMSLWTAVGGNRMLIFLAALQGVPSELYEASAIDGAGRIAKLVHITLPMISPAVLFNLILGIISALQVFTLAWTTTAGGPSYGSWFFALHIYQNAFQYFRLGYASALSWLFVIVLISFTIINLRLSQRWVYYAGA